MAELHALSATSLIALYRQRALSPVEVVQDVLRHIEKWEPHINATFDADPEDTLRMARASQERWFRGAPCGPLDGVPITIKDNLHIAGRKSPIGSNYSEVSPAVLDCPPVARVREAGAVFVARTTIPDYGMLVSGTSTYHGVTRNPWDTRLNPAGSSCGAGAAAAAGYGPLHLGTDIGGSVRMPSAWCGVFGLKPSLGRVPIDPPFIGRVTGPMTRTVEDAALLMSVLSGPDSRDYMSLPQQQIHWGDLHMPDRRPALRIGLLLDAGAGDAVDPEIRAAAEKAAQLLQAAGAIVEPIKPWQTQADYQNIQDFFRLRFLADIERASPERKARMLPFLLDWSQHAQGRSAEQAIRVLNSLFMLRGRTVDATQSYDYVLSPTSPIPPFAAELANASNDPSLSMSHAAFTQMFNLSEQPAASINCGFTKEGMPIGLQIVGRRFDDIGVLRLSRMYEELSGQNGRWPKPPTHAS